MDTLLVDQITWDLVLDAEGNIAKATNPYSLAQDAASVIRTYLGEVYFDTTVGMPWQQIQGRSPSLPLLKQQLVTAAETVPEVASAQVFLTTLTERRVGGQVQVFPIDSSQASSVATFEVINPQGG